MIDISVIVPIYHGLRYIKTMISQIEACQTYYDGKIEILFVNDDPKEPIEKTYASDRIEIVIVDTDVNRGIHGARIRGMEHSKGTFILFLDQDDRIAPDYLKKQIEKMGDGDAVVCRAFHEGKPLYNRTNPFENVINQEYMLRKGNPIISPGQVLIKKKAISEIWRKNVLTYNGADDWLLWLCMIKEGRSFRLNDEILFEHVVEGSNTSLHVLEMQRSEIEMFDLIRRQHVFSKEETAFLEETIYNLMIARIRLLERFQRIAGIYDVWLNLKNQEISLAEYMNRQGYKRIAIYGVTNLGKRLYQDLSKEHVEVSCFIDINASYLDGPVPIYLPEEELPEMDVVIISLVQDEKQIRKMLREKMTTEIRTIAELIEEVSTERKRFAK